MLQNKINKLADSLAQHKALYYRGQAQISDEEYDKLEAELKKLDPNNPVLSLVGSPLDQTIEKMKHSKKMLSLEKTYKLDELEKWIENHEIVSLFKIDGSSCSLVYRDGHLVQAKTRGDGELGENILGKVIYLSDIPKTVSVKHEFEVRGEVFCTNEKYIELCRAMVEKGLESPTSQRNIVAGLLGRKEHVYFSGFLNFFAFDLIDDSQAFTKESEKLTELEKRHFLTPEHKVHKDLISLEKEVLKTKDFLASGNYLIDGLVVIYNDLKLHQELGETSHHPRYKIAFKFQGDTKEATINNIEWNVSRNGKLTPVANIEPVELSGAMIARVTLHNMGMVETHRLKAGDVIQIVRSGEVIPKFLSVIKSGEGEASIPTRCPSCGTTLDREDIWLMCNNSACPDKNKEEILYYIKEVNIEDVSDKRLLEMIQKGFVKKIPDLYDLTIEQLLTLEKVKEKLATKMYENIQKTKKQKLTTFISAIGLEGISSNKCEKIIAYGHNSLDKMLKLTVEELIKVESFAEKSAQDFVQSLEKRKKLIQDLLIRGIEIEVDQIVKEGALSGIKICITGDLSVKRPVMEAEIKAIGGILVSSVSKNTSILLTNETDSSSSKFVKAKELNIPVMTEAEFREKYLR